MCVLGILPLEGLRQADMALTCLPAYNYHSSLIDSFPGIVLTHRPLKEMEVLEVTLERLNPRWTSSLSLGVAAIQPDHFHLPITALGLKKSAVVVSGDGGVYVNGTRTVELAR